MPVAAGRTPRRAPGTLVLPRIYTGAPVWWVDARRDECVHYSNGRREVALPAAGPLFDLASGEEFPPAKLHRIPVRAMSTRLLLRGRSLGGAASRAWGSPDHGGHGKTGRANGRRVWYLPYASGVRG